MYRVVVCGIVVARGGGCKQVCIVSSERWWGITPTYPYSADQRPGCMRCYTRWVIRPGLFGLVRGYTPSLRLYAVGCTLWVREGYMCDQVCTQMVVRVMRSGLLRLYAVGYVIRVIKVFRVIEIIGNIRITKVRIMLAYLYLFGFNSAGLYNASSASFSTCVAASANRSALLFAASTFFLSLAR